MLMHHASDAMILPLPSPICHRFSSAWPAIMLNDKPLLVVFLWMLASIPAECAFGFTPNNHIISRAAIATSSRWQTSTSLDAKKQKKAKRSAQTTKGFGAPPPKLEDVLAGFKTRMPDDADSQPCPCGTAGKVYGECCGPLHKGDESCLTMTDVLRSRYSAFTWRNIEREDKVALAKDLNKGGMLDSFEFVYLQAGEEEMSEDNENEGFVEFKVTLRAKEDKVDAVAGQETVISERSRFLRDPSDGSWSYASGDVRSDVAGLEDTTLNA